MAEKAYIERSEALDVIRHSDSLGGAYIDLAKLRYADVRPVGLLEQVEWERDTALAQLAEIGKSLGEKMDDVRPVVYCKDCRHRDPEDNKCDCGQLERAGCVFPVDDDYFCAYGEES